jgi:DNA primase
MNENPNRRNIRERLLEYLEGKIITPNHNGLINCLWHDDKNPSCKVNDSYVYCYACNESGDIYKVAAALLNLPCDRENFREIANDIERTLGIPEWQPQARPSSRLKLSKSVIYRSELLKDFSKAIDTEDFERAFFCASLLFALFMLPEGEPEPRGKDKPTLQAIMSGYGLGGARYE